MTGPHTPRSVGHREGYDYALASVRFARRLRSTGAHEACGATRHELVAVADLDDPGVLLAVFAQRKCGGNCDWDTCIGPGWCEMADTLAENGIDRADELEFFEGYLGGVQDGWRRLEEKRS